MKKLLPSIDHERRGMADTMRSKPFGVLVVAVVAVSVLFALPSMKGPPEKPEAEAQAQRESPPAAYEEGRKFTEPIMNSDPWLKNVRQPRDPEPPLAVDPRLSSVLRMTENDRSDDFPAIASNPANLDQVYAVWISYSGRADTLRLARYRKQDKIWGTWNPVPGVSGDVWRPALAYDSRGRVWVIWSERVDGNFDLYGRWYDGTRWGPRKRFSTGAQADFDHRVATTASGEIHLVWQGFRDGQSDIFYLEGDGVQWSAALRVSTSDRNDWAPAVAVSRDGKAHVVWDTYDAGNYDVLLRSIHDGKISEARPIASTPSLEAHATIAIDKRDRLWIAYDVGSVNWGKDYGAMLTWEKSPGAPLYGQRQVEVVCLDGGRTLKPSSPLHALLTPSDLLEPSEAPLFNTGQVIADDRGGVHLIFHQRHGRGRAAQYWRSWIATMTAEGWAVPAPVPHSRGRLSMRAAATPAGNGTLWLAWPSDNHPTNRMMIDYPEETIFENVFTGIYTPSRYKIGASLTDRGTPDHGTRSDADAREQAQVRAIRHHRIEYGGKSLSVVRGDLHRHTELSLDGQGTPDGSVLDYYRYMLDAAAMDFGAITDHQSGAEREYWWWLTQKLEDLFLLPSHYISLFGYERSVQFPDGHRNVIWAKRGFTPLAFLQDDRFAFRLRTGTPNVIRGDAAALFDEVGRQGGITIPHTSAAPAMGTDWRDNDPVVEPLVEIFQGDRYSSEYKGAPLDYPDRPPPGPNHPSDREKGYVSNAWQKGYRLGVITSSDHISTHLSYAMVWTEAKTREAIVDSMKARHTYGATDNIILEFWLGNHLMGDEFAADRVPAAKVKVIGTAAIDNVHIFRNNQSVYQARPDGHTAELSYQDTAPKSGLNYYYVRVVQADKNVAWSSPIWITVP